jgi:glycosyltransferase involved in cell wall biosynthesis
VNPTEPKEVAEAMHRLLTDENFTESLGKKARNRVYEKFTIERSSIDLAEKMVQLVS